MMFPYCSVRGFSFLADLSRKRERERLKVRREPYWQRLEEGQYLGFRRGPDTWIARYRDKGDGKGHQYHALGEALEFDDAKKLAESWLAKLARAPVRKVKRSTVKAALESYLADLRRHGREAAAKEALGRFKLTVHKDALADLALERATLDDFLEWRDRLLKGRAPRSVNRQVRSVVAGLNRAIQLGHVGSPSVWRLQALSDDEEEDGETAIFLSAGQRKSLIAAASPSAAIFFRGLELTGARPKELAAATASDFDGKNVRLAHRKGKPPTLKVRYTVLSGEGVAFFEQETAGKAQDAPIFTEDGTQPWRRHIWAREMRQAAKNVNEKAKGAARIPAGVGAYAFRHARISELLQIRNVDPLTVAVQLGTSLAMIEKAYLRFIPAAMREKLAGVKEV
jgi:integrase